MQPDEKQAGLSSTSHLLNSLKAYLNNKNRLQPIIGLRSIIECVKAGSRDGEALYLCEACVCRLSRADVRNHFVGSLHRYNYIKSWHPHLVSEWKVNADLSKLAWPLMEKAKILEGKEGPGHVRSLAVGDAVYQRMASLSENDAVTLINMLRDGLHSLSEATPEQVENAPTHSQRVVLFGQKQQRQSLMTSSETNTPPSLEQSTMAPSFKSRDPLDGFTRARPVIGLSRMTECRSEDGHTLCFLCHCCRVRTGERDVVEHQTSSSHLVNYLMETRPEQVEVMMADMNYNHQLLQSLANDVEQEEGRGLMKVVKVPESLCSLQTGRSYHWCVKRICKGRAHTDFQKRRIGFKGPSVHKASHQNKPGKFADGAKVTKRKMRKKSNTVFNVSMPLSKDSVLLLQRTSFSRDSFPASPTYCPPSDSELTPSYSQSDTESCVVERTEFSTSQPQHDPCSRNADTGQSMWRNESFDRHYQDVNRYRGDDENFSQSRFSGKLNYTTQHGSQERSSQGFYKEWPNENPETQNQHPSSAASHTLDWLSNNSSCGRVEVSTDQWYNSTSQITSNPAQYYQQQQTQYQYMGQDHASLPAATGGQQTLSGASAHLDAAWTNMYSFGPDGYMWPDPRAQCPQTDPRSRQMYMWFPTGHFQTISQSCVTQSTSQPSIQEGHEVVSYSNFDSEPTASPDHPSPQISVVYSPRRD